MTIVLDPSLDALAPGAKEAIVAGLRTWGDADLAVPELEIVDGDEAGADEEDGVFRVMATDVTDPAHVGDLAYTRSYANGRSGKIVEADIVFNTKFLFAAADEDLTCEKYDLTSVAAHEMGHFLGLSEDPEPGSTMYVETQPCNVFKRWLTDRDLEAAREIYETPAAEPAETKVVLRNKSGCNASGAGMSEGAWAVPLVLAALRFRRKRD